MMRILFSLLFILLYVIPAHGMSELYNGSSGRAYCSYTADSSPYDFIGSGSSVVRMEIRGVGGSDDGKYWTSSSTWTAVATTLINTDLTFYRGGLWYIAVTPSTGMTGITVHCFTSDSSGIPYDYTMTVFAANRFDDTADYVKLSSGTGTGQISLSSGTVTVGTNNDKTNYGLANDAIGPAQVAAGALTKGSEIVGFNDLSAAEVQTEAEDAIVAKNLDFLITKTTESNSYTSTTTDIYLTNTQAAGADSIKGMLLGFSDGGPGLMVRRISAFDIVEYKATVSPAFSVAPTNGLNVYILNSGFAQVLLDAVTHTGAVVPTVSTLTGHTAQTGDSFVRLGAPAGASISADIASRASQTSVDTIDNFVDTEITDIQSRLPSALVGGRMDSDMGAISTDATAANNLESAYDGTGYCEGCIAVTVSSGAATPASPLVITETTIITVDNQFVGQILRCGKQERQIVATDDTTADTIIVEPGNPFIGALSGVCYIQ